MNVILNALSVTLYMAQVLFVVCDVLVCFFSVVCVRVSMEVMGRLVCLENKVLKETQVYQVCQEFKALLGQRYLAYRDNNLLFICIYHNISCLNISLCCDLG